MRKFFGVLAVLSFLYALGVVGGIEQDTIPLVGGFIRAIVGIGCFGLFSKFAGAYDY